MPYHIAATQTNPLLLVVPRRGGLFVPFPHSFTRSTLSPTPSLLHPLLHCFTRPLCSLTHSFCRCCSLDWRKRTEQQCPRWQSSTTFSTATASCFHPFALRHRFSDTFTRCGCTASSSHMFPRLTATGWLVSRERQSLTDLPRHPSVHALCF